MNLRGFLHNPGVKACLFAQVDELTVKARTEVLWGEYEVFVSEFTQVDFAIPRLDGARAAPSRWLLPAPGAFGCDPLKPAVCAGRRYPPGPPEYLLPGGKTASPG